MIPWPFVHILDLLEIVMRVEPLHLLLPPLSLPRRRPNRKETWQADFFHALCGRSVMSAQLLEVSLFGVGTVLRLERDAWSTVQMTETCNT